MKKDYLFLKQIEENLLNTKIKNYYRDDFFNIERQNDVIWLFWERWVWKTTIMLQKRKKISNSDWNSTESFRKAFYFSADNASVKINWLFKFVFFCFNNFDVEYFFIDEIFKYSNRKTEIKNIIDALPQCKIVFSGSSSLALYDWIIDLWRRVYDYKINTLSFREYLKLKYNLDLKKITFNELINKHQNISVEYAIKIKEIYFQEYIKMWAYPFWLELNFTSFANRLQKTLNRVILEDLAYIKNFHTQSLDKISKLIYFIANTTPSELSINHISQKIWVDKTVVDNVLFLLSKIWVINLIQKWDKLSEKVRKEYKIFLWDTNKYYIYNLWIDIWIIREAFFVSELKKNKNLEISLPSKADFKIQHNNNTHIFEIWWKSKKRTKYPANTFIIKDDIQVSENEQTIPLWLFWFLN